MKYKIDFEECMKDSPTFRHSIESAELRVHDLETRMEKLVKTCKELTDAGKVYNNAFGHFITSVKDLTVYFNEDTFVMSNIMKFVQVMSDLKSYHVMLEDQIGRAVSSVLNNFIKKDIKKVKETKKYFDRITEELDTALNKNSQVIKAKPQEADDARKLVVATRSAFGHTAFDYSFQLNELQSKERQDVLNTLMSFMNAHYTFFHQGFDLLKDLQPTCKDLGNNIKNMNERASAERKEMEGRRNMLPNIEHFWEIAFDGTKVPVTMEGYLYKRANNAFKTWNRRWFTIKDNQLIYQKRSKGAITIAAEDLRLCNVKPFEEIERRFCFEVVSPGKTIVLQADSEQIRHSWIQAMQAGINSAFNVMSPRPASASETSENSDASKTDDKTTDKHESEESRKMSFRGKIKSLPGNEKCADCKRDDPTWACINFGTTVCIACSGVHRSMGVHLSKVRSLTLDKWEPETVKVMLELGNTKINQIYEAKVDESIAQPALPHCANATREKWIKAKYEHRKFVSKDSIFGENQSSRFRRFKENKKQRSGRRKAKEKEAKAEKTDDAAVKKAVSEDSGLGGSTDKIPSSPELARNLEEGFATSDSSDAEFMDDSPTNGEAPSVSPQQNLYAAAASGVLPRMAECLAQGANINEMDDEDNMRTPLHKAVTSGSLTAVEYLLLNGAKVNVPDKNSQTVLHLATQLGNTGMVCLLLKRGADQSAKDVDGQDALKIAINTTNADIVTLLRLAQFNEEMRESELNPGDETMTFQDVFKDFTDLASYSPEKLKRNSTSQEKEDAE